MTEIEQKALALVNEVTFGDEPWTLDDVRGGFVFKALCRAIEQHEAFKREVSDAVEASMLSEAAERKLRRFILPKPVDPLVEALAQAMPERDLFDQDEADKLRAALAKRGLEVRETEG